MIVNWATEGLLALLTWAAAVAAEHLSSCSALSYAAAPVDVMVVVVVVVVTACTAAVACVAFALFFAFAFVVAAALFPRLVVLSLMAYLADSDGLSQRRVSHSHCTMQT